MPTGGSGSSAFMENIVNVTNPHHPAHGLGQHTSMHMEGMAGMEGLDHGGKPFKAIDPKDPLYPCSIMAERYLESCYEMQTSIMLYLNQGDMAATAKKYQPWCYIGLVKNLIDLNAKPADGMQLCRELTSPASKVKCYEAVGEQ